MLGAIGAGGRGVGVLVQSTKGGGGGERGGGGAGAGAGGGAVLTRWGRVSGLAGAAGGGVLRRKRGGRGGREGWEGMEEGARPREGRDLSLPGMGGRIVGFKRTARGRVSGLGRVFEVAAPESISIDALDSALSMID